MKLGFVVSACVAWMAACGMDNAGRAPDAVQNQKVEETGLVTHSIMPNVTDPAIDQALDDHLTWIDRDARTNHKLFVYMPGTGSIPARHLLVQREAARLGYHVIGLMYANSVGLAAACPRTADPNACFENARLEVLDGIDRTPVVNVNRANSIDNRLTKLLRYLDEQFPEEGWSRFLAHGEPRWSRIAVAGHSQGGGQAAMIAKLRVVPRVAMFSAVPDSVPGLGAPTWEAEHATPSERYWGLVHEHDGFFGGITAGWVALGMNAFGALVRVEASGPPYDFTHSLKTDLIPRTGSFADAHPSTVQDSFTPVGPDGTPLLLDAWRYMLTAEADDHDAGGDDGDGASRDRQ